MRDPGSSFRASPRGSKSLATGSSAARLPAPTVMSKMSTIGTGAVAASEAIIPTLIRPVAVSPSESSTV